ncbi:MAG: cytochrome c oxidase accessory protein CcoG, partial [Thiomicrorhabdus sp.]|nr:cytochrome c oxidase accessory protein CcoG [Thiomicrorhabdus sp.]
MSDSKNNVQHDFGPTGSMLEHMDTHNKNLEHIGIEILPFHTGCTVHAKRIPGFFRTLKWLLASAWLVFFIVPYL